MQFYSYKGLFSKSFVFECNLYQSLPFYKAKILPTNKKTPT